MVMVVVIWGKAEVRVMTLLLPTAKVMVSAPEPVEGLELIYCGFHTIQILKTKFQFDIDFEVCYKINTKNTPLSIL